jgi:hypothetical protein
LKQAVISIAHGVELLLKERLRKVHPSLIWENVDKFPNENARTVSADHALSRLIKIGGLQIEEDDLKLIKTLGSIRNAIIHFGWKANKKEVYVIVGSALGFSVNFAKLELDWSFFGYHTKDDDTFEKLLKSNSEFNKAFSSKVNKGLTSENISKALCPNCNVLAVDIGTHVCSVCEHTDCEFDYNDDIPF